LDPFFFNFDRFYRYFSGRSISNRKQVAVEQCCVKSLAVTFDIVPMFRKARRLSAGSKPLIIAAPMNGGINNAVFAAAVINAGGVGSFGFTYHTKEAIERDIIATRALCNGPINANFFVYDNIETHSEADLRAAVNDLKLRMTIGNDQIKVPSQPYHLDLYTQLEGVWKLKPAIVTFHFGIPDGAILREAQKLNIYVGITATSLEEAQCIQENGADFIVAQGIEAGGHRGMFNSTWSASTSNTLQVC
jgi:nitronate monooxygenase